MSTEQPRPEDAEAAPTGAIARLIDFSARKRFFIFLVAAALTLFGLFSARRTQLDALPDLSDTQVIVATEWMGRSPTLIEDQVTYPVVTSFLGAPSVKTVRGFTMFGMSFVYVVFKDGTDIYWARSRVVEQLAKVKDSLPEGVTPQIGPDATSVGWVYQYALVDESGTHNLQELRSFQDWHLRYWLQGLEGVAEVASVGGFEKEYQIQVDPARMKARGVSVGQVAAAVRGANTEVGGRVIEMAQHEYVLRGRGYVRAREDLDDAVVATDTRGTPIRVRDVADVTVGGNLRRGVAELDGRGEVVGGIVVMRHGENALHVIDRVKSKLEEVRGSLPAGVKIVPVYDRSELIVGSVKTLSTNLVQILGVVILVIFVFLFHLRSALVAAIALPVATAATFIAFYVLDLSINIMSLAGIILALGDMVDSACVLVENAHRKIEAAEREGRKIPRAEIVIGAARELGPSMFGALLVLTIAFLPVFTLEGEEGRLFRPLALAKTFSMAFASLFAVTLVPALMVTFLRGRITPEQRNPINRLCIAAYRPVLRACLRRRGMVIAVAVGLMGATVYPMSRLGSEFMPPLEEGDLLFMPVTVPGIPIAEARRLLAWQDAQIRTVPEVERVFGKAGRAETALDPAPLSMFETVVRLKPKNAWRPGLTQEKLVAELEQKTATPGVQGAWTMPIKARIDMLATGIRTPIGVKVFGPDLEVISRIDDDLERVLRDVPGTRSVYAERELGGFFLDITPDRQAIARYGLSVRDVLDVVESTIGGMDVDTTFEGRERYRVSVRYPRELRDNIEALRDVPVPVTPLSPRPLPVGSAPAPMGGAAAMSSGGGMAASSMGGDAMRGAPSPAEIAGLAAGGGGSMGGSAMGGGAAVARGQAEGPARAAFVPLGQLARIDTVMGPPMIKSEMGSLTGWIYIDTSTSDIGGYVESAKVAVARDVELPAGYYLKWTGQYELLERVRERLAYILPLTIGIVFVILYLNFNGAAQTLLVMTGVPFAAVGAIWTLYAAGFNTSIAVWVGMIALLGVAAETASVMIVYLDEAWTRGREAGTLASVDDLIQVSLEAGAKRVRPLLMTVLTNVFGLLPVLLDDGVGSDVAKRIAAPMWGGLVSLTLLTLLVIPAMYVVWRSLELRRATPAAPPAVAPALAAAEEAAQG
ncbi:MULTISPECIES: efflux RND transporter permease subunit [Sorangium]|uniref:Probable cation efflux system transmembrane protein n=1 Tax=Sorangium cellulosum (strain So ce56) TaxID=448385 RepID=A9FLT6_SORC5|nr:CusA/CzcA family heavy metal efflux RND transporter [Sorangium cellulosum]CAN98265.1 probable cation efflux system transmembrane protein [Sorangium cellulosum So ce56]